MDLDLRFPAPPFPQSLHFFVCLPVPDENIRHSGFELWFSNNIGESSCVYEINLSLILHSPAGFVTQEAACGRGALLRL